ncbi:transposable element Tcb1 transposase [Trichonephila clavipes]|nr:transposable element Tcb1 transposase [Trichonephila clavipes]
MNFSLSSCNASVPAQIVRNVLHSAGLKARTPRKKPYISEVNRKRRLEFAMKYKNEPMDFWERLFFSDESKFEIFSPSSIRKIWRKNKTALEPKNVLPTLKHGGGNVMVWGCVAHNGAGNLAFIDNKMNALAYIDVLRQSLLDSAKKLSMEKSFIFQQGNDPKHTAIVTNTWLLYHAPRTKKSRHKVTGCKRRTPSSRSGEPQRKRHKVPERQLYERPSFISKGPLRKETRHSLASLHPRETGPYNLCPRNKVLRQLVSDHKEERCKPNGDQSGSQENDSRSLAHTNSSRNARFAKGRSRSRGKDDGAFKVPDELQTAKAPGGERKGSEWKDYIAGSPRWRFQR